MLKTLLSKKCIPPEKCKYFSYNFKKSTNLGTLYSLPKIHKRLYDYLDYDLKPILCSAKSYKGDTSDFFKRLRELGSVPHNTQLVTADR